MCLPNFDLGKKKEKCFVGSPSKSASPLPTSSSQTSTSSLFDELALTAKKSKTVDPTECNVFTVNIPSEEQQSTSGGKIEPVNFECIENNDIEIFCVWKESL